MKRYVVARVGWLGLMLAGLLCITFAIARMVPGDPARLAAGPDATESMVETVRAKYGLDRPLPVQFGRYLAGLVAGDLGQSIRSHNPVRDDLIRYFPNTLELVMLALALAVGVGVPLGMLSAVSKDTWVDHLARVVSVSGVAVPAFWLGLVVIWLLGVHLQLVRPFSGGPSVIVIAVAIIAFHSLGVLARVYRRDMLEQAAQPYFRTALAKGLSHRQALWRHCHAGAFYALLAAVRSEAGWVIGGSATLEVLFGLPGISQFLVQSISARDYHVLLAYVMVVAAWMLIMSGLLAFWMRRLDPRHS